MSPTLDTDEDARINPVDFATPPILTTLLPQLHITDNCTVPEPPQDDRDDSSQAPSKSGNSRAALTSSGTLSGDLSSNTDSLPPLTSHSTYDVSSSQCSSRGNYKSSQSTKADTSADHLISPIHAYGARKAKEEDDYSQYASSGYDSADFDDAEVLLQRRLRLMREEEADELAEIGSFTSCDDFQSVRSSSPVPSLYSFHSSGTSAFAHFPP